MNVIFMGTPDFALPSLQNLADNPTHNILAVVTQPDRPKGRHLHHRYPPPVKRLAEKLGLEVIQTDNVNEPATLGRLRNLGPDLIIVVAFGQRLSHEFLEVPRIACINLHASLLPKYRGAAPIIRAIVNGEKVTGVTAQKVVYEMDAGDIIAQEVIDIGPDDTAGDLEPELALIAGSLLIKVLGDYQDGSVSYTPQREELVSYAPRVMKKDGLINWNHPPERIHNFIRGMNPRPGAFSFLHAQHEQGEKAGKGHRDGKRLIILRSRPDTQEESPETNKHRPGTILDVSECGIRVAVSGGSLWITQLQPEGGRKMSVEEYIRGHPVHRGQYLRSG